LPNGSYSIVPVDLFLPTTTISPQSRTATVDHADLGQPDFQKAN